MSKGLAAKRKWSPQKNMLGEVLRHSYESVMPPKLQRTAAEDLFEEARFLCIHQLLLSVR